VAALVSLHASYPLLVLRPECARAVKYRCRKLVPRPNWLVGAAKSVSRGPALDAEIEDVKRRLRDHRTRGGRREP
jgi:hypothetical protein